VQFLEAAQQQQQRLGLAIHLIRQGLEAHQLGAEPRFPVACRKAAGGISGAAVVHSVWIRGSRIQVVESRDMVRGMGFLHR
jgi:hypothetical protein